MIYANMKTPVSGKEDNVDVGGGTQIFVHS